jgi:hypothetical protein
MNRDQHAGEGGIPRRQQRLATAPNAETQADWRGANGAKTEKLRRRALGRLAHSQGLELRHSAYGYALIDAARQPIEDRHDLNLDEVESRLAAS